ncbi:hypothetical protein CLFO_06720 [Clostridium formicaceticum]|uniref:Uncharacterized protein n=1 Tax=Clostridium formicaceticum TaxID=1497 RepID=A0AAC9RJ19_9CLOT|nr:hypothetical protein CLFO_06720 [Clostridium formicaceticum]
MVISSILVGWEIATEFDALDQGPIGFTVLIFLVNLPQQAASSSLRSF